MAFAFIDGNFAGEIGVLQSPQTPLRDLRPELAKIFPSRAPFTLTRDILFLLLFHAALPLKAARVISSVLTRGPRVRPACWTRAFTGSVRSYQKEVSGSY